MRIVLVYSGQKLPKHHLANVRLISQTFPERQVITVVDHIQAQKKLSDEGLESFLVTNELEGFNRVGRKLSHSQKFRKGFWYATIKRFYLLREYFEKNPESPILHIESDVLLFPNFPFETLASSTAVMAYPFATEDHAAASVFFVRNCQTLDHFLRFIEVQSLEDYDTDMTLLAKYADAGEFVTILPTLIPHKSQEFDSTKFTSSDFGGIFDAATYGQYLFGLDPRNHFGLRKLYLNLTSHFVNPQELEFELQHQDIGYCMSAKNPSGLTLPLFNLHVHSKDLRIFKQGLERPRLILKRCSSPKDKPKYEIDASALIFSFPAHLRGIVFLIIRRLRNWLSN